MAHLNVNTWDGYSEGVKYNSARSKVTDYLLAEYSEIKEELDNLGVSENDYESIQKLVLADTDNITDEYMNSVAEVSQTNISFVRAVKRVFWSVIERGAWVFNFLCIIELVLLLWCMCLDIEKCEKFKIILAWVGAFIMLIYFQYIGRAPERIYVSLLFAVNFVEFTVLHKDVKTVAAFESVIRKLGTLAACSVLVAALYQVTKSIYVFPQNPFLADRNADVTKYRDILDSNNTYVWSVFSFKSIIVADFMEQGKLIPEEILNCNIVDGEWTYGQVYYNNYLKNIGIENPMEALLYGKNMFYVSDSDRCDLILTYLKEHYDETVQAVQMGEIENVKIWRFFVSEKNVGDSTVT